MALSGASANTAAGWAHALRLERHAAVQRCRRSDGQTLRILGVGCREKKLVMFSVKVCVAARWRALGSVGGA